MNINGYSLFEFFIGRCENKILSLQFNPTDWETAMESIPDHFDDTDPKLVIFSLYKNVLFKEYFMDNSMICDMKNSIC